MVFIFVAIFFRCIAYSLLMVHLTLMRSKLEYASVTRNFTRHALCLIDVSNNTEVFLFVLETFVFHVLAPNIRYISMFSCSCSYSSAQCSAAANAVLKFMYPYILFIHVSILLVCC